MKNTRTLPSTPLRNVSANGLHSTVASIGYAVTLPRPADVVIGDWSPDSEEKAERLGLSWGVVCRLPGESGCDELYVRGPAATGFFQRQ